LIKLVNIRAWIFWVVLGTAGILFVLPAARAFALTHFPWLAWPLSLLDNARNVAVCIAIVASLIFIQRVWRGIWRFPFLGNYLSDKIFPDLNGRWTITIRSNWPIIDALREAARDVGASRLDVRAAPLLPPLGTFSFEGEITQTWRRATFVVFPNEATPLRISRTVAFDLIRASDDQPKRVAWVFRQENAAVAATDEDNFLGAALLEVTNADRLTGKYWNNRSWRLGLNAAGEIEMSRLRN
jgi:hypothetical protein